MQNLKIDNFGPIPNCDLELKDFMIFIGEQATGKSTICKCVYFFKLIRDEVKKYMHDVISNGLPESKSFAIVLDKELRTIFNGLFGSSKQQERFLLSFTYADKISITVEKDKGARQINFTYSSSFKDRVKEMEIFANNQYRSLANIDKSQELLYVQLEKNKVFQSIDRLVNDLFRDSSEVFYIPAGRSLITLLTEQAINFDLKSMDYITSQFLKTVNGSRSSFDNTFDLIVEDELFKDSAVKKQREKFIPEIRKILKGEYRYKNEKEYIVIENDHYLPVNFISSGQQEILWILYLLYIWVLEEKKVFVVIEEPEAHLYPNAQKGIVEYIALFTNSNSSQVMITTHSPYILTAANNLLYAGNEGNKYEKVKTIINEDRWLNTDSFSAYMIGKSKSKYVQTIIDDELKEIAAEEIDTVSGDINKVYSDIYNLGVKDGFTE